MLIDIKIMIKYRQNKAIYNIKKTHIVKRLRSIVKCVTALNSNDQRKGIT